jgi:hypothetical protein
VTGIENIPLSIARAQRLIRSVGTGNDKTSISDPHWFSGFYVDPDLAFEANKDPGSGFR